MTGKMARSETDGAAKPVRRSEAEIAEVMDFRARRAVEHFKRLAVGGRKRTCPVCGYVGPFSPVRHKPEVWCPGCDSRPRHRLMQLWLDRTPIHPETRVLHFAAEPWLAAAIRGRAAEYITADINDLYDLKIDIEAMALPDARFELNIANPVLEPGHDRKALDELFRVLSPGGLAALTVPLVEGWEHTLEMPQGASAEERALRTTDPTHLRFYGRDFRDRLDAAGFEVAEFTATEPDVGDHALHIITFP